MDEKLRDEVVKNDLGHKIEDFKKMGIKTYKDMAHIRGRDLTEECLFDYAEVRKFDILRASCISKVNERSQQSQQEAIEVNTVPTTEFVASVPPTSAHPLPANKCLESGSPQSNRNVEGMSDLCQASSRQQQLEFVYTLDKTEKGLGLIFVNEKIKGQDDRTGADQDTQNFVLLFQKMGLTPVEHKDRTCEEIKLILYNCRTNFSQCQMLAVAISTHGGEGDSLYGSDGTAYSLYRDVVSLFTPNNCPMLAGKPKVFFIQSCRGDKVGSCPVEADGRERPCVTLESDFLVAHSTVRGYKSFRHTETGSWFVTKLREMFEQYRDSYTLMDILTFVNQIVIQKSIEESSDSGKLVQTCQLESTLTKLMRFHN